MLGPPGARTTEVEPDAELFDAVAAGDAAEAVPLAVAAASVAVALERTELACSGVMVVTEVSVDAAGDAEPEDEPDEPALPVRAKDASCSGTMSM